MKKILLLTGVLLALSASYALAVPGLDAAWGGCPLQLANPSDVSDPCDDSGAPNKNFWLSFKAPAGITRFVGEEFIMDVQTDAPILPDWWHLEAANASSGTPAGCRDGEFSFGSLRNGASTLTCKDYWGNTPASGGVVWLPGNGGPNRTRVFGAFARSTSSATVITADVEYYVGAGFFSMNHADLDPLTTPCNGCLLGACIVFQYMKVAQPAGTAGGDVLIEAANLRRHLTWQGGTQGPSPCPAATEMRKATWGQVKSLYR
jgi:hypothetical protein